MDRDKIRKRIGKGEVVSVVISPRFFGTKDFAHYETWKKAHSWKGSFNVWIARWMRKRYDIIFITSEGDILGVRDGLFFLIAYQKFPNIEAFLDIAEKYGIEIQ